MIISVIATLIIFHSNDWLSAKKMSGMQSQGHILINSTYFRRKMTSNHKALRQLAIRENKSDTSDISEWRSFYTATTGLHYQQLSSSFIRRFPFFVYPSISQSVSAGLPQIGAVQPTVRYSYRALGLRQPRNLFPDTRQVLHRVFSSSYNIGNSRQRVRVGK